VPVEYSRDVEESDFTPILRGLLRAAPSVLAAIFVDREGECIDYCSSLSPYDAKVIAAHMIVLLGESRERPKAVGGEPWWMHVLGSERDLIARRVDDEYVLVVATGSNGISSSLCEAIEHTVTKLRSEVGLAKPSWEPTSPRMRVDVRTSTSEWAYAPETFWYRGDRTAVADVLGRWIENPPHPNGANHEVVCFLVRSENGEELTLVHRPEKDEWERR
jgi:predicted regulator of Ras-like GTPase activity (Roadblock/LC7/MglB family)